MDLTNFFQNIPEPFNSIIFGIILIWEIVWKGLGLWKASRNNQKYWFISMLLLNTIGILPIVYIKFFQGRKNK